MPIKRYALLIALVLLALSLKGSVYLRLMEMKLHLSEFEKYFRLEDGSGTGEVKKGDETPIPSKTDFLKLMGRPTEERPASPAFAMNYTFLLKPAKPDPGQNPPHAWASFEFHPKTHLLRRLEARFAGTKLSMTFENAHPYPVTP